MLQQYMTSLSPNNRPQQQSSPSDNQSMSTATPPHQSVSRASPASTALVMSMNNINSTSGNQLNHQHLLNSNSSRQLSPNTQSNSESPQTSASSSTTSNQQQQQQQQIPPNPMARQFACHAKSMSAGVVVSVPGISNNLATAAGMNQNNMINNNLIQHPNHTSSRHQHQQQQTHQQQQQQQTAHIQGLDHRQLSNVQQQVIREYRNSHSHNHQLTTNTMGHQTNQYPPMTNGIAGGQKVPSSGNHQNSSIILTQNNLHNRSASAQMSNVLLASQNQHNYHHHHHDHHHSTSVSSNHLNSRTSHHHQQQQQFHSNQHPQINSSNQQISANSIWSIDENLSKSHNKLASSNYLPDPYMFGHSITDLSCDNLSNISRLMDQPNGPAPAYFDIHPQQQQQKKKKQPQQLHHHHHHMHHHSNITSAVSNSASLHKKQAEFLPICDLMFNLISMIIYFCENTFAIIALIALYYHTSYYYWALIGTVFVIASNFVCQYLSYKWLYQIKLEECHRKQEAEEELEMEEGCDSRNNNNSNNSGNNNNNNNNSNSAKGNGNRTKNYYNPRIQRSIRDSYYPCGSCAWLPDRITEIHIKFLFSILIDAIMHILCLGFLIRYIKLVIPVTETASVKREARDLCLLRMIHSFVQSAPLLLLQSFMIYSQAFTSAPITNLSITSALLSLLNVCWALASFTKYARKKYMHKFVLTWLGIISQLLWRLGTVSSRVVALTIYAVYYNYWSLVVLALHWLTMFFWFIKPGNLLRDEMNLKPARKISIAAAVAWIYCFCFVNFEEHNSKLKMTTFYLIMFLENNLLLTVCMIFSPQVTMFKNLSIVVVYLGFSTGMLFMFIYYKNFHVNILSDEFSCSQESVDSIADQLSPAGKKVAGFKPGTLRLKSEDNNIAAPHSGHRYHSNINATLHHTGSQPEITRHNKPPYLTHTNTQASLPQSSVFNCKINTALRKPKIPSAHVRHHN